jgi:O-acetyl-ADP-ribose deacetylase (regulator of RNase III)
MRLGKLEVEARVGDLTKLQVDAVVNPANSLLVMGGGAAGALKRAGGEEIEREARRHAPLEVGRAVATGAGRLPARWVVHAPTMERPAMPTTEEKVYRATLAALRCADEIGAESLAIPGMGTGVGGVPIERAAEAMVRALREFAPGARSLKRVVLCDISEQMVSAWKAALER